MKNHIIKRLIIISLALAVVLSGTTVNANIVLSKSETTKYINTIAHRQMSVVTNPTHSSAGGEWTVMGLARAGKITTEYKNKYKRNLKKVLDNSKGELSTRAYTDYSRTVIALTSIGENPFDFYGYDVISPLVEFDNVNRQGLNGVAYALIALNCGGYKDVSPRAGYEGRVGSIEKYKNSLAGSALPKGGWALFGKKADVDMTAIAIQALAPFYGEKKVKAAIDKGLEVLSDKQKDNGGYESMGNENCESSSQVLAAISSIKVSVKDKRFVKKNHTVLDGLMSYYKNGAFKHLKNGQVNQMSTDQGLYALVAYRNTLANDPPLFNMKKVAVKNAKKKAEKHKKKIEANNSKTTTAASGDNNKETKKKSKKKKTINKNTPTTVNIIEETTVKEKTKIKNASSWWWIGLIVVLMGSSAVVYVIYRKQRGRNV